MHPHNILLIRLSSIGDVLHSTPVAKHLRLHFPQAKLTWIVGEKSKDIVIGNPHLDELIIWEREKWETELRKGKYYAGFQDLRKLERQLKGQHFDMAIDLHGLLLTGLIAWRSGAKVRIGFANAREGSPLFYTERVVPKRKQPITNHYLSLLGPLGIKVSDPQMILPLSYEDHAFADKLFAEHNIGKTDTIIGLNPSTSWMTKCWPPEHFGKLANMIGEQLRAKIMLFGAPADVPLIEEVLNCVYVDVINIAGKTSLKELAAVAQRCTVVVSGDTGPLHMAAAVGTPTVALFGPTDPQVYAPVGKMHQYILADAECQMCYKRACKDFLCMKSITPEQVLQAIKRALGVGDEKQSVIFRNTKYKVVPITRIKAYTDGE